jgi:glycosyltransferase involved in cell wall biosynthesis
MRAATQHIVLIEPWYAKTGHGPFNRSFINVIREGFPTAQITFVCSSEYRNEIGCAKDGSNRDVHWIEAPAWTQSTVNGGIGEFWRRTRWLVSLLGRVRAAEIIPTHLIVLGSSGPILLAMFVTKVLRLPKSCRTFAVLHGATELLNGWHPRNPLRRLFSFRSTVKRLSALGIKIIALETFIAQELRGTFPNQAGWILCIPHACDETESLPARATCELAPTLRVLYLGQATPHKGFLEFVRLAELARASSGTQLEFRAAGAVRPDTRDVDQSALARRARDVPLERGEFLAELAAADLVFTWQSDYYEFTPSGILLDCIGLGVPMTGRRSHAIALLETEHGPCGLFTDDLESLRSAFGQLHDMANRHALTSIWRTNLAKARIDRCARALGDVARRQLEA